MEIVTDHPNKNYIKRKITHQGRSVNSQSVTHSLTPITSRVSCDAKKREKERKKKERKREEKLRKEEEKKSGEKRERKRENKGERKRKNK